MNTPTHSRRLEFLFYVLAAAGLIGTNVQIPAYFQADFLAANVAFWKDTVTTPAATFILVDIFVLGAAVLAWMFAEGRRLGIRAGWIWAYFLGSAFIGISFAFPLFLAHRERRVRSAFADQAASLQGADWLGVAITAVLALWVVAYSLRVAG